MIEKSPHFVPSHISIHMPLLYTLPFCLQYSSLSHQAPDKMARPLATAQESTDSHLETLLLSLKVDDQVCGLQLHPFPFPVSFRATLEYGHSTATISIVLYPQLNQSIHKPKLRLFLLFHLIVWDCSYGHRYKQEGREYN